MNVKEIKTLVGIMEGSSLTALEIQIPELKVRLERTPANTVELVRQPSVAASVVAVPAAPAQPAAETQAALKQETASYREIKAPMVGVFYAASAPEAEPYVAVGSQVKKGQVVCIIEAMKLMNEIAAEEDGRIVEVCVKNGQIVEYGQTLFKLS